MSNYDRLNDSNSEKIVKNGGEWMNLRIEQIVNHQQLILSYLSTHTLFNTSNRIEQVINCKQVTWLGLVYRIEPGSICVCRTWLSSISFLLSLTIHSLWFAKLVHVFVLKWKKVLVLSVVLFCELLEEKLWRRKKKLRFLPWFSFP